MVNSRGKGAAAEREAASWLQTTFKLQETPLRNLEQVRSGGFDLTGFPPFAFEIKRCETLDLRSWWRQAVVACNDEYHVPVVMYRQSRVKWKFLISCKHLGLRNGYLHLEAREFKMWVNKFLDDNSE